MELGFLNPLYQQPGPWASAYVPGSPATEDGARQYELTVRAVRDDLASRGADEATRTALAERLARVRDPGAPGTAIFATDGRVVLDFPLPVAPSRPLVNWSALPHTSPLLTLLDDGPACLVAFVDRTGADFELRGDPGRRQVKGVRGRQWPMHRTASADWSERHFQNAVENTWEHNAGEIAHAAHEAFDDSGAEVLVLVGDPRERRAVHERLPESLRAVTVETEHGGRGRGAKTPLLDEVIERARHEHRVRQAAEILDRYRAGLSSRSEQAAAVAGVPALVEAAQAHRIDTLLVGPDGPDLGREVWVGPDPDQLSTRRSDLQYLGETSPHSAPAGDALLRSAATTGVEVLTVPQADQAPDGGLGALLRGRAPLGG